MLAKRFPILKKNQAISLSNLSNTLTTLNTQHTSFPEKTNKNKSLSNHFIGWSLQKNTNNTVFTNKNKLTTCNNFPSWKNSYLYKSNWKQILVEQSSTIKMISSDSSPQTHEDGFTGKMIYKLWELTLLLPSGLLRCDCCGCECDAWIKSG